jgi:hypothetical protein
MFESFTINIACGWKVDLPFKSPLQAIPNNTWHERIFFFLAIERRFMLKKCSLVITISKHRRDLCKNVYAVGVKYDELRKPEGRVWLLPHFFVIIHDENDDDDDMLI